MVLSTSPNVATSQKGVSAPVKSELPFFTETILEYLSISFGWAIGTALGVWVGSGYSGGHINPAVCFSDIRMVQQLERAEQVTLSLATFRGFPWRKVSILSNIVAQCPYNRC